MGSKVLLEVTLVDIYCEEVVYLVNNSDPVSIHFITQWFQPNFALGSVEAIGMPPEEVLFRMHEEHCAQFVGSLGFR